MNGIHDMGGMQGLGELVYDESETMFHAPWEGRVHTLSIALGAWRGPGLRPEIEAIPAADYLRMSYYDRWLTALTANIVKTGLATRAEIDAGRAAAGTVSTMPEMTVAEARAAPFRTPQTELDLAVTARFEVGQRVRGRNLHPTTHTRMPRYTRGREGVIERDRGVFALPDNDVYFLDPRPQHVYLIRYTASARDSVYIDLWEDYLEPA
jgi:nitrile hydratase subunit beta